MLTLATLALGLVSYAASPQAAAVAAVRYGQKKPPIVLRVNRAGVYATVLIAGGKMEGAAITAPILVKHFTFGWQPLALLNFHCSLDANGLSAQTKHALMQGMPTPKDDRPCNLKSTGDTGPAADVTAIRKIMRGPLVPDVGVYRDWALGDWYGAGGGQALFHKRAGHWQLITHGGGAMGVGEMQKYGVPESAWCVFNIYDARCP